MASASWNPGDLGRFKMEDPSLPRFEFISLNTEYATIWYSNSQTLTKIPRKTFLKDCVNWWVVQEFPDVSTWPDWLKSGESFCFESDTPPVRQMLYSPKVNKGHQDRVNQHVAIFTTFDGESLKIRNVRRDYASCETSEKILLMVPTAVIVEHGFRRQSKYQRLLAKDTFKDPDEELEIAAIVEHLGKN